MARFFGRVRGGRGEATRTGTAKAGMIATASGWEIGGRASTWAAGDDSRDRVDLDLTAGTNAGFGSRCIAIYYQTDGGAELRGGMALELAGAAAQLAESITFRIDDPRAAMLDTLKAQIAAIREIKG